VGVPSILLSDLKAATREIDAWEEDSESFQAALVVVAPLSIKTMDPEAVATFTGVAEPLVREYAARLLASGFWLTNGKLNFLEDPESDDPGLEALNVLEVIFNTFTAVGRVEKKPIPEYGGLKGVEPSSVDGVADDN
jgi:hypothetical protein